MAEARPHPSASPARSPMQRAEAHVLPVAGCPPLAVFHSLLGLAAEPAPIADEVALLERLTAWSRELFISHDRALSSCTLFHDIQAKLATVQKRAAEANEEAAIAQLATLATQLQAYPFPLIHRVQDELGELQRSCGAEEIDDSWTVLDSGASGERIATYYRTEAGSGTHSFLVSGLVQAPLLNLVAMLKEAQLLYKWIPAVSESTLLSPLDASRYRMLLRVTLKLFWPLANREAMLYAYGDMVSDSVGVFFRSTDEKGERFTEAGVAKEDGSKLDVTVPPVLPGAVRVDVKVGGFWFTPQPVAPGAAAAAGATEVTRVRAIFNVDPKFSALPFWFLNVMSKKFCAVIIALMREKAPKLFAHENSAYAHALREHPRTYEEIQTRLEEMRRREQTAEADRAEEGAAVAAAATAVAAGAGASAAASAENAEG